jgi:hypothetical protein
VQWKVEYPHPNLASVRGDIHMDINLKTSIWQQFGASIDYLADTNLRHVHGHASQLNMLLGQQGVSTPDYVTRLGNESS